MSQIRTCHVPVLFQQIMTALPQEGIVTYLLIKKDSCKRGQFFFYCENKKKT